MQNLNLAELNETERLALLFGILLGDGCLSHHVSKIGKHYYNIIITCNYYDDKPFFNEVVQPLIFSLTGRRVRIKERPLYGAIDIYLFSKYLFYVLSDLGFTVGKKKDIIIPSIFHGDCLKYVVAGLFATDGCLTLVNNSGTIYPRIFFTASLPSAFLTISKYLTSLNIKNGFYTAKRKFMGDSFVYKKQQYVISSNGPINAQKFRDLIGFINPKHELRYSSYIERVAVPRIELGTPAL